MIIANITIVKNDTEETKMKKIIGYCRKSRAQQNIERQVRNILAEYPNATIIKETFTGTKIERPEWQKIYKCADENTVIVFDSVSRMSRNAEEGFKAYEELFKRGVSLVFLKEPHINTETFKSALKSAVPLTGTKVDCILEGINKYLMELAKEQIRIAFEQAQKEVDDLHQRVSEGLITAKLNGKRVGAEKGDTYTVKKAGTAKADILRLSKDFNGTLTDIEVMKIIGIARNTYYKYKAELKKGLE